jgi:hypothetical protein
MIIIAFEEYFLGNCIILERLSQQGDVQTGNGLNVNYYRQLKKKKNLDKLFSPNDRKFLAA